MDERSQNKMHTSTDRRKGARSLVIAAAISAAGLALASVSTLYIAGMFGLSIAFATQIIAAVSVGGWVLAVVMGMISGGIAGVVVATARWALTRWGEALAAA
jgi:hypothetical protein